MINGCLFSCWNRLSEKFPRLKNIIAYVLKPVALAMNNAIMNILFYRNLSYISSEDAIVFSYYLGVNYLGMLANQLGKRLTKKIQNIYFKFFLQSLFNAYLTNPSLLGHLAYEGLETPSFLLALGPMLSMIVSGFFFQIGECLTQKMIGKFFPVNTEHSNRNNQEYFLRYSVVGDMDGDLSEKKSLNALANNGDVGDVTKIAPHEGQNLLGSFTEYTEREAKTKASVWGSACLFPPPPSEEELNQLNVATIVPKR